MIRAVLREDVVRATARGTAGRLVRRPGQPSGDVRVRK